MAFIRFYVWYIERYQRFRLYANLFNLFNKTLLNPRFAVDLIQLMLYEGVHMFC